MSRSPRNRPAPRPRPRPIRCGGCSGSACKLPASRDLGDCLPRGDPYLARRTSPRRLMADIETPCNKVCALDPVSALCVGCGRTVAEIAGWIGFTAEERARIMAQLPQRLAALQANQTTRIDAT